MDLEGLEAWEGHQSPLYKLTASPAGMCNAGCAGRSKA
jgi:hypothetical protein